MKKYTLQILDKIKLLYLEKSQLPSLFTALMGLNFADVVTTTFGLSMGGKELNPLFPGESFITIESVIGKMSFVLLLIGLLSITFRLCKRENFFKGSLLLSVVLIFLVGFYLGIIIDNSIVILVNLIIQVL